MTKQVEEKRKFPPQWRPVQAKDHTKFGLLYKASEYFNTPGSIPWAPDLYDTEEEAQKVADILNFARDKTHRELEENFYRYTPQIFKL